MVLVKLLGLLDMVTAVIILILALGFEFIPYKIIFIFVIYLWVKAFSFRGSMTSILDGLIGIYLLLSFLFIIKPLSFLIVIHLFLKGMASLA